MRRGLPAASCYLDPVNRTPTSRRNAPKRPGRGRGFALWAARLGVAALAVPHVWLLGRRVADASILEPLVLVRWLLSAATVAAIVALRRRGRRIFQGREGLALLLTILLLHSGAFAPPTNTLDGIRLLLPAELVLAAAALAFVLGRIPAAARPLATGFTRFDEPRPAPRSRGYLRLFASRPPPRAALHLA